MKLNELLQGIHVLESNVSFEMNIEAVAYDSRKVTAGSLFVAITGFASDGNRFIPMAMEKGAAVVVTAKKPEQDGAKLLAFAAFLHDQHRKNGNCAGLQRLHDQSNDRIHHRHLVLFKLLQQLLGGKVVDIQQTVGKYAPSDHTQNQKHISPHP